MQDVIPEPSPDLQQAGCQSDAQGLDSNQKRVPPEMKSQQGHLPLLAPSAACLTTYGWQYDPALDPDDNFLDLALAVSRNSRCEGGHMGCVFVRPNSAAPEPQPQDTATPSTSQPAPSQPPSAQLLVMAINSTLYDPLSCKSDVHAEQNGICAAARVGLSLQGCTTYITMPPCRTCFGLLHAAGVQRVVFRKKNHLQDMETAAERLGMALVGQRGHEAEDASLERVKRLWQAYIDANPERAAQELAAAKEMQRTARELRKRKAVEKAAGSDASNE